MQRDQHPIPFKQLHLSGREGAAAVERPTHAVRTLVLRDSIPDTDAEIRHLVRDDPDPRGYRHMRILRLLVKELSLGPRGRAPVSGGTVVHRSHPSVTARRAGATEIQVVVAGIVAAGLVAAVLFNLTRGGRDVPTPTKSAPPAGAHRYRIDAPPSVRSKPIATWEARQLRFAVSAVVRDGLPEVELSVADVEDGSSSRSHLTPGLAAEWMDSVLAVIAQPPEARPGERAEYRLPGVISFTAPEHVYTSAIIAENGVLSFHLGFAVTGRRTFAVDGDLATAQMLDVLHHIGSALDSADAMAVVDTLAAYQPLGARVRAARR